MRIQEMFLWMVEDNNKWALEREFTDEENLFCQQSAIEPGFRTPITFGLVRTRCEESKDKPA